MKNNIIPLFFVILIFFSCDPDRSSLARSGDIYVPVYGKLADITKIEVEDQKPTVKAGKIYVFENYIFQNDINTGIHIINNTDRQHPVKIAFLKLPLSTEIAIKEHFLYTNNYKDLVVFDISTPAKPLLIKRVKDVFPGVPQQYPPARGVYFECPDPSKGVVMRWEKKDIPIPNCRR